MHPFFISRLILIKRALIKIGMKAKDIMKKVFWTVALIASMAALFVSCDNISCTDGDGNVVIQDRQVEQFTSVALQCEADIYVRPGETQSVDLIADENLLSSIETYVSGGTLYIDTKESICPTQLNLKIILPELKGIKILGSGSCTLDSATSCDKLILQVDGSGDMRILNELTANTLDLYINGSGDTRIQKLIADICNVDINGSGDTEVYDLAANMLYVNVNGSGDLAARGETKESRIKINGSGDTDLIEVKTEESNVGIYGSGNVRVWIIDLLQGIIEGSGDLYYKGNPYLDVDVYGSGDLVGL